MAVSSCPMCGEATAERDRFCAACGVRLDTPIVLGAEQDTIVEKIETAPALEKLAPVLVPLSVAAVLGLAAIVLFAGDDGPEATTNEQAEPTTPATASPATPAATQPSPTEQPTPTPTPNPSAPVPTVDVSALPPTSSTHVAITRGLEVGFLDLQTGEWTIRDFVRAQPHTSPMPFQRGIVVHTNDAVVYAPVDGPAVTLRSGWAAGATADVVWIYDAGATRQNALVAVDAQGTIVDEFVAPGHLWVRTVLANGDLVVQGAGRVFTRSSDGVRALAQGDLYGVVEDRGLLLACDEAMTCGFELLDLASGEVSDLDLDVGLGEHPQLVSQDQLVLHGAEAPSLWQIEDGEARFERELSFTEADRLQTDSPLVDVDQAGLRASLERSALVIRGGADDALLVEVDLGFFDALGNTAVRFISVDG